MKRKKIYTDVEALKLIKKLRDIVPEDCLITFRTHRKGFAFHSVESDSDFEESVFPIKNIRGRLKSEKPLYFG